MIGVPRKFKEFNSVPRYKKGWEPLAYSVASIDPKWNRDCWVYTGDDCIQQFLLSLDELKLELADVMNLQLPIKQLSPVQQEKHNNATKCYLCQKQFNENEETARKHADHCHITG